jgi:hypothetical protein
MSTSRQSKLAILGSLAVGITILANVTGLIANARALYKDNFGKEEPVSVRESPDILGQRAELYGRRKHNWLMAVKDSLEQDPPVHHVFTVSNACGSDVSIALRYKLPGPRPIITEGWFPVEDSLTVSLRAFVGGSDAGIYITPDLPQFRWIPNSSRVLGSFVIPPGVFADDGSEIVEGTGTDTLTFERVILGQQLADSVTYEIRCEQE